LSAATIREFVDDYIEPHVRGFLHLPATPNGNGLVLTHGAGSNAQAPLLIALAETFSSAGFTVLRCNLPYRQNRSWGPPGPGDAARDRTGLKNAIAAIGRIVGAVAPHSSRSVRQGGYIFMGGHSYGGRQSSMLCAEEPDLVAGLLLLSYPLHPPRKPEQLRTGHLPNLRTPTLFVQGTRDPFGSIAEIGLALKMIPAKTNLLPIEGAGHDLGFKGKAKRDELMTTVFEEFLSLFAEYKNFRLQI
jgi:uncharacterized protein